MNREIEFRAWNKQYKEMHTHKELTELQSSSELKETRPKHFFQAQECLLSSILRNSELANRYILMQFTGLTDKNGTKIFEGDVITADWHWDDGYIVDLNDFSFHYAILEYGLEKENLKIIGNIHENKELL